MIESVLDGELSQILDGVRPEWSLNDYERSEVFGLIKHRRHLTRCIITNNIWGFTT